MISTEQPATIEQTAGFFHRLFKPAAPKPLLTDPHEIASGYEAWGKRVLVSSIIGYATYYLVRKNLSVAMPVMEKTLHFSKSTLGLFLTLHGVLYGISKFLNGFLGDRCNARAFLCVGLAASALLNVLFGFGSSAIFLGIVWLLNGWVQGMGFPPCARLLTHWYRPRDLPTKMSIWNTSHCIGAIVILLLCGFLVGYGWRLCFFIPAGISLLIVGFVWFTLPDTPPSVGLPERPETHVAETHQGATEFWDNLVHHVFSNKYVWLVSIANFFVYTLRYAVFDWGPTLLTQTKHIEIKHASWMLAGFEVAGAIGALIAGWATQRWFQGRPMRTCVFLMVLATASLLAFWKWSGQSPLLNTVLLCLSGFFIYGPQCLVGIAAANLATKKAAATAVGLTGLFGYLSTIASGWGLGTLVQARGWDAGFLGLIIISVVGVVLFACGWNAKAHGYQQA
jgi:sugar phosphate permease